MNTTDHHMLTPAQQDYIETIYLMNSRQDGNGVRVMDIAQELGTKSPTVVRTLARLKEIGLVEQEERSLVYLTDEGVKLGAQLAHRHTDVCALLVDVLGVPEEQAHRETCIMEHGFSGSTAQRLHQFLLNWNALEPHERHKLRVAGAVDTRANFSLLERGRGPGSRK